MRAALRLPPFVWAVLWCAATVANAANVVTIEEHWELEIGQPEPTAAAPQVSMVMSPTGDLDCRYFVFTLNHRLGGEQGPGGLQLQLWDADQAIDTSATLGEEVLWRENEVIRWTQRMSLESGQVLCEIVDGDSDTWGDFGGDGVLRVATDAPGANLNSYRPGLSINESGVDFAGNRVRTLTLTKLRWSTDDGQEHELVAPIDIDTDIDP